MRLLKGHSGAVNSVAFTADGTHIVSAGNDRTVRIWDAGTGEQLRSLRGHKSSVSSVACSPDGKLIASGSHDKTIRVWDALTGKEKRAIRVTDSRLIAISPCVAFSPDGKWIASAIHGGRTIDNQDFMHEVSIALWDAQTGEKKVGEERLLNLGKDIQGWASIAFSPSGEMILFVGRHCFDPITGYHRFSLPRSSSIAWTTRLSADGTQAATPMQFGTVKLWDASSLENLLTLGEADGRHTKYVAFSPDGRRICSGSVGGQDQCLGRWKPRNR